MDCPVCFNPWDLKGRRPKALLCQHTLCAPCLGSLPQLQCPTCLKVFTDPVPDNLALVACLEALELERWWCLDCQSATKCMAEHDVRRPKAALRRGLQDWMPAAVQDLQGLQDGLQGLQDGAALTALRLLRGMAATCKVTLQQDDGEAFGAEWRVDGKEHAEDSLLRTLVVALAASGRLHQEAAPATQQLAEQRIEDLGWVTAADPGVEQDKKDETLHRVRQHGVRRMTGVKCCYGPAWCLDVLRSAAPTLEELQVYHPREEHLLLLHRMPRLRRLFLLSNNGALDDQQPLLPALPRPSSLQWLLVEGLPRATTQSLLQAHAASLEVLLLGVGAKPEMAWPDGCSYLHLVLGVCGLRLSRLVLWRYHHLSDEVVAACRDQVAAAHRVLPRECTVQCKMCDHLHLPEEDF